MPLWMCRKREASHSLLDTVTLFYVVGLGLFEMKKYGSVKVIFCTINLLQPLLFSSSSNLLSEEKTCSHVEEKN